MKKMSKKIPSPKELLEQLSRLRAEFESVRKGDADLIIGDEGPLVIRLKSVVEEKERLQAEMELLANQWQTTFESVNDAIFILDNDFRILRANKASEKILGRYLNEIHGKHCYEIVHGADEPVKGCPLLRIRNSLKRETDEVNISGKWFEITVDPIIGSVNKIEGAVHILSDITEKKTIEKALQQSEENFKRSVAESPLGIRIVDEVGETVYANKSFLNIHCIDNLEEFNNTPSKLRYTPESYLHHQERKEKRKKGEEITDYETDIVRKDGEICHIKVTRNEILWNGKKYFQVINQDITNEHKLKLELIAAKEKAEESDRLKTAFLHNISHEIRTPLNAIVGFTSLLSEPGIDEESKRSFTETIIHSSDQLLAIINEILEISNIEAGIVKLSKSEVNINHLIHRLYDQYLPKAKTKNLDFCTETPLPEGDAIIITDNTKIIQILTNLLNNAFKFTSEGNVKAGYIPENEYIKFYVSDTGTGIPADQHIKIFERFYQVDHDLSRQYEGTGIGLSIVKAYVELLGGRIWVESEPGKGSAFYFTLPITYPEKKEVKAFPEPEKYRPGREINILVAEDDEASLKLISRFLDMPEINLIKAVNGKEAVDYCKSGRPVDLVLMDIKMPVMDGYEAASIIRKLRPYLPIIIQSAYCDDVDKFNATACGCNDFITKPSRKDIIISKIREYLPKQK